MQRRSESVSWTWSAGIAAVAEFLAIEPALFQRRIELCCAAAIIPHLTAGFQKMRHPVIIRQIQESVAPPLSSSEAISRCIPLISANWAAQILYGAVGSIELFTSTAAVPGKGKKEEAAEAERQGKSRHRRHSDDCVYFWKWKWRKNVSGVYCWKRRIVKDDSCVYCWKYLWEKSIFRVYFSWQVQLLFLTSTISTTTQGEKHKTKITKLPKQKWRKT